MIPFTDFGGSGLPLHFAHANGYPPACYRPLLKRLSAHYHVTAMHLRPLWPGARPQDLRNWRPLTDDFLRFLDEQRLESVIAVGHSMGGTLTLRAALREPERFRAIVLLDPVFFPPYFIAFWWLIFHLGLSYRLHPLVRGALRRRREFDDLETLFRGYRRKRVFRYLDDESLRAYVEGIVCPKPEGGYRLCYSPEWEARIYVTGVWGDADLWHGLPGLRVPMLIVRGAETDTFWERTARRVQEKRPGTPVVTVAQSTHLLPLERPQQVFEAIREFLQSL